MNIEKHYLKTCLILLLIRTNYHNFLRQRIKPQIDKVITIGKKKLSNKKRLFSKLQDKKSVTKVFTELSKRYSSRKGGYSRVLKAGFRTGDDTDGSNRVSR